jgi:hypothetical protein
MMYGSTMFIAWDGHNSEVANQVIARHIVHSLGAVRGFQE